MGKVAHLMAYEKVHGEIPLSGPECRVPAEIYSEAPTKVTPMVGQDVTFYGEEGITPIKTKSIETPIH